MKEILMAVDINALLGVVLGFLLGELSYSRRERRQAATQRKSVRSILQTEVDANGKLLHAMCEAVSAPITGPADEAYVHCKRYIDNPFPPCKSLAYESQLPVISSCLDAKEIALVHDLHCQIDRLRQLHELIARIWYEQQSVWDQATEGTGTFVQETGDKHIGHMPRTPFHDRSARFWATLSTEMDRALKLTENVKLT